MRLKVSIVPASGDTQEKNVNIKATGTSVGEIRKKAKIDDPKMAVSVNGEPARDNTHVGADDQVTFTERASGS